jgi:hypothetical protein
MDTGTVSLDMRALLHTCVAKTVPVSLQDLDVALNNFGKTDSLNMYTLHRRLEDIIDGVLKTHHDDAIFLGDDALAWKSVLHRLVKIKRIDDSLPPSSSGDILVDTLMGAIHAFKEGNIPRTITLVERARAEAVARQRISLAEALDIWLTDQHTFHALYTVLDTIDGNLITLMRAKEP